MFVSSVSPASAASAVWAFSSRTLTSLGVGVITALSGIPGAVPASTRVVLTAAGMNHTLMTIAVTAGAAGTTVIGLTNGSTDIPAITVAAGQSIMITVVATPFLYPYVTNNDALNTTALFVSGFNFN